MAQDNKSITAISIKTGSSSAPQDIHWVQTNIPCQTACPAGTDIPGYLEAIYHEDFEKAYAINWRDNVFPGVLGRVCSRPCEDACRHGRVGNGESVAICFSKHAFKSMISIRQVSFRCAPIHPMICFWMGSMWGSFWMGRTLANAEARQ